METKQTNRTNKKSTGSESGLKTGLKSKIKLKSKISALSFLIMLMLAGCADNAPQSVENTTENAADDFVLAEQGSQTEQTEAASQLNPAVLQDESNKHRVTEAPPFVASDIPAYTGESYAVIHDNRPYFDISETITDSYEFYSDLDTLGRCGVCVANIGTDLMPTTERGEIGNVRPTGWQQNKYIGVVDGNYLYNRCHLISYQLTGENANEKNLITGTRSFNEDGMLPFENMVADYIKETGNHVLYRVTPVFAGNNLLADGVLMEAESVEDAGAGILFCVFCYNVQPGIEIDYADGSNALEAKAQETMAETQTDTAQSGQQQVFANPSDGNSGLQITQDNGTDGGMCWKSATGSKYHSKNNCGNMNPDKAVQITIEEAEAQGLERCKKCW